MCANWHSLSSSGELASNHVSFTNQLLETFLEKKPYFLHTAAPGGTVSSFLIPNYFWGIQIADLFASLSGAFISYRLLGELLLSCPFWRCFRASAPQDTLFQFMSRILGWTPAERFCVSVRCYNCSSHAEALRSCSLREKPCLPIWWHCCEVLFTVSPVPWACLEHCIYDRYFEIFCIRILRIKGSLLMFHAAV